jgi:MoaA/NifB/PqqE/SkfB family radical SAM enzyme
MDELMPAAYVCNLGGTNYGEMTIAQSFPQFLADCCRYDVRINLTTNGTCIRDRWLDELVDRLTVIGFSMEGMNEQFEMIRGFAWSNFLQNIQKVLDARRRSGARFTAEWRYCAHVDNIHQLPDMIRLASDLGIDRIQMMNLVPYLPSQKHKQLGFHRSLANRWFAEARAVADALNFNIEVPPDFDSGTWQVRQSKVKLKVHGKSLSQPMAESTSCADGSSDCDANTTSGDCAVTLADCHLPWQACSINELGQVRPCCTYWRPMGSIDRRSFAAVWNGWRYRRLRRQVNSTSNSLCTACRMPRFDNETGTAAWQSLPGLRELAGGLVRRMTHRRAVRFDPQQPIRFDPPTPDDESADRPRRDAA